MICQKNNYWSWLLSMTQFISKHVQFQRMYCIQFAVLFTPSAWNFKPNAHFSLIYTLRFIPFSAALSHSVTPMICSPYVLVFLLKYSLPRNGSFLQCFAKHTLYPHVRRRCIDFSIVLRFIFGSILITHFDWDTHLCTISMDFNVSYAI